MIFLVPPTNITQKIGLNMNTATKKPGLQALAFSTAIQRILHFFTFSHAQFPPDTLSPAENQGNGALAK